MKLQLSVLRNVSLTILLLTAGCGGGGGSGDKPADGGAGGAGHDAAAAGASGSDGASTDLGTAGAAGGSTDAAMDVSSTGSPDASSDATTADTGGADGSMTAVGGTVTVTEISVNGNAKPDFTCVTKGSTFLFSPFGQGGIISVGCNNGSQTPTDIIAVGFGANATVGTQTEATGSTAASIQNYTTVINATGSKTPAATTHYTITIASWDMAALHAVGTVFATWDKPTGAGAYGTFKMAFDVVLKTP